MVKVIVGLKGSGKTKKLVELVSKAVNEEQGDVICIEKDRNLTFDIPYQARLIYASDYQIGTFEFMKGFISGLRAGNYELEEQIKAGMTPEQIKATWQPGLDSFKQVRKKYLMYPDFE